ncbi:MAG TPA: undecaprenyl-diphosphate phosphatase [Solirubrobacteraceae bacterium]|jgi:undecaprenyl-diphosphatase
MRPPASLSPRHAIALGLAHGPCELLPVSSSAHTILIPWLAGWPYGELDAELRKSFEVALHAGTAVALTIDLARRAAQRPSGGRPCRLTAGLTATLNGRKGARGRGHLLDVRRAQLIALSLLPPAAAGYALEEHIQRRLSDPATIAGGLLVGSLAMGFADARNPAGSRRLKNAGMLDGLLLGGAQALALAPGVSRSGATLAVARARGFGRRQAAILSRQVGLPVILGASALKGGRLLRHGAPEGASAALAAGGAAAFLSTLVSIGLARRGGRGEERSLLAYCLYRCALAAVIIRRLTGAHNMS